MKYALLIFQSLLLFCFACKAQPKTVFNGSFEKLGDAVKPVGWNFSNAKGYLDSAIVKSGKYAFVITNSAAENQFVTATYTIPQTFKGNKIELRGYLKTENITGGYAGLWLRIDGSGTSSHLAFDNMSNRGIKGTTDWKEYSIELPYDDEHAARIVLGGLIVGSGKMWLDGLTLYINGKPIEQAIPKSIIIPKAQQDTAFSNNSSTDTILISKQQVTNLTLLGEVWGLLKYYHPLIANGEINMDAELFRVLPGVLKARNNKELSTVIEKWVDQFGIPAPCTNCPTVKDKDIVRQPDYGSIFNSAALSTPLCGKLKNLIGNSGINKSYYIDMTPNIDNPVFMNELPYSGTSYPDAGLRLLALYRYWNMIQYFYPYKDLIGTNWDTTLTQFIPQFCQAGNALEYQLSNLRLISSIHDTHANIWSAHPQLESYRGKLIFPVQAKFIGNKLIVTGYYTDTLEVKQKFKIGDIISSIDGIPVEQLVQQYLPITAASNLSTQLRDMPRYYLLRSNKTAVQLEMIRDGKVLSISTPTFERRKLNTQIDYDPTPYAPAYRVMENGIAYLYPGRYKNKDLADIKKTFAGTKGMIIDMRCYPSEFMPFTFVPYVKTGNADFVKFTIGSITKPGLFKVSEALANNGTAEYKGKVVIIVNEQTQSQAEYTTMAFQSSPNVMVIGSTTAGADGNVSPIVLPGGIRTMISGIGILYPDNTQTQRKGVKIDVQINPTIEGIKVGKDELMEKATAIILQNK